MRSPRLIALVASIVLVALASLSGSAVAGEPAGTLDKDAVREVIRTHRAEVATCYETALAAQPALEGRVVLAFTVAPDGAVARAEVAESTLGDEALHACLMDAAMDWRFAAPGGAGEVVVRYPFTFTR